MQSFADPEPRRSTLKKRHEENGQRHPAKAVDLPHRRIREDLGQQPHDGHTHHDLDEADGAPGQGVLKALANHHPHAHRLVDDHDIRRVRGKISIITPAMRPRPPPAS